MTPEATRYSTIADYNTAYPHCPVPLDPHTRHRLATYHAAMAGIEDDVHGTGASLTLEFLPHTPARFAQGDGEPGQLGTVIATRWGRPPVLVLVESVPLATARKAILTSWPTRLTDVYAALGVPVAPADGAQAR